MRTYIIGAILALALGGHHVEATKTTMTILWDSTNGRFNVHWGNHSGTDLLAWGTFDDQIKETGWGFLEIHTNGYNGNYLDYHQAYAAGLLESLLTSSYIEKQWRNEYQDYCVNNADYCDRLNKFLNENLDYMLKMAKERSYDTPFWHHVALTLVQLAGIDSGMSNESFYVYVGDNIIPNVSNIMQLSLHGDLFDLENVLGKEKEHAPGAFSSCSGLIKMAAGNSDILAGHTTWTGYNTMLRIQKRFTFEFHETFDSAVLVPGNAVSFSSYPGRIISGDDFYVLGSGLLVSETTIENNNPDLYKYTTAEGTVPSWIRNTVANRLASTTTEWTDLYSLYNSGTYNNQWMIVDYKLFQPTVAKLQPGLFRVLEQMPGTIVSEDMTSFLEANHHWPSYNVAYFPEIFNISGQWDLVKQYGDWYTYDKTPRALIFKRDQEKAVDAESLRVLLRYNDFKNDPLSKCNCTPPYSAENAIASRCDLNPANGTYPIPPLGHRPRGATDVKVINSSLMKMLNMMIQSGPTNDIQPTFVWSLSDFNDLIRHEGHPDVFNFQPVTPQWIM